MRRRRNYERWNGVDTVNAYTHTDAAYRLISIISNTLSWMLINRQYVFSTSITIPIELTIINVFIAACIKETWVSLSNRCYRYDYGIFLMKFMELCNGATLTKTIFVVCKLWKCIFCAPEEHQLYMFSHTIEHVI